MPESAFLDPSEYLDEYLPRDICLVCWLKQIHTTKQQVYEIAVENSVVIIEVMRNIHAHKDFFENRRFPYG